MDFKDLKLSLSKTLNNLFPFGYKDVEQGKEKGKVHLWYVG